MSVYIVRFLSISILITIASSLGTTVCAKYEYHNQCELLAVDNYISCNMKKTSIDCLLSIENESSSFGRVTSEEAAIASEFSTNIVVIGEVVPAEMDENVNYLYETAVLVKINVAQTKFSFNDLRNKKICHPGFDKLKVSRFILNEFEEAVLNDTYCNILVDSQTLVEKYIKGLSNIFHTMCRPGSWVDDPTFDKELKQKYPNLCALCPGNNCSNEFIKDTYSSAMECLIKNDADAVITTVNEVIKNQKRLNKNLNHTKYVYLCRDGTITANIYTSCSWTKQSFDLIVAHKNKVIDTIRELNVYRERIVRSATRGLLSIIVRNDDEKIRILPITNKTLKEYFKDLRKIPNEHICKSEAIRWCVISEDEKRKCNYLKQASLINGIYPQIECIQSFSVSSCINDISNNMVDIMSIDKDYRCEAKRANNLIAVALTNSKPKKTSLIIVKNSANITRFKQLEGRNGCISELDCIGKNIFYDTLKEKKIMVNRINISNYDNYPRYDGPLQCLNSNGDFAVITTEKPLEFTSNIQVLCKTNILVNVGAIMDDDCYLLKGERSEVITTEKSYNNSKHILHSIEKIFGWNLETSFELFNVFNDTENLLFKHETDSFKIIKIFLRSDVEPIKNNKMIHIVSGSYKEKNTIMIFLIFIVYFFY